jgi:hypothetical protein
MTPRGDQLPKRKSPSWLELARQAQDDRAVGEAFEPLYDEIQRHLGAGDYEAISNILELLAESADDIDLAIPVAGLCSTWMARSSIANWTSARDRIAEAIVRAGHQPKKTLFGLYEGPEQ